jgi:hypothetical protein
MISSYVGENAEFERQMLSGELSRTYSTRNLAEKCRQLRLEYLLLLLQVTERSSRRKEVRGLTKCTYGISIQSRFCSVKAWKGR